MQCQKKGPRSNNRWWHIVVCAIKERERERKRVEGWRCVFYYLFGHLASRESSDEGIFAFERLFTFLFLGSDRRTNGRCQLDRGAEFHPSLWTLRPGRSWCNVWCCCCCNSGTGTTGTTSGRSRSSRSRWGWTCCPWPCPCCRFVTVVVLRVQAPSDTFRLEEVAWHKEYQGVKVQGASYTVASAKEEEWRRHKRDISSSARDLVGLFVGWFHYCMQWNWNCQFSELLILFEFNSCWLKLF